MHISSVSQSQGMQQQNDNYNQNLYINNTLTIFKKFIDLLIHTKRHRNIQHFTRDRV